MPNTNAAAKKAPKRKLQDLSPKELRELYRETRAKRDDYKAQLAAANERNAILAESERQLRGDNAKLAEENERLRTAFNELNEQFERAVTNNTKLTGVIEATDDEGDTTSDTAMEQVVERLDIIIGLMGGERPTTEDDVDGDDEDEDDADDQAEAVSPHADEPPLRFAPRVVHDASTATDEANNLSDDDAHDEDEGDDEDHDDAGGDNWREETADDAEVEPIHGIDAAVEGEQRTDAVINAADEAMRAEAEAAEPHHTGDEPASGVTEDELTMLVSPAIKAVVDSFEGYEDTILAPVRDGGMTKELALRTIVAQAYPQHPEMAEAILNAQTTRDAVYELMGL